MATWMQPIAPISFSEAHIAGNCNFEVGPHAHLRYKETYTMMALIFQPFGQFVLESPRMVISWTCTGVDLFRWSWVQFSTDIKENGWRKWIWNWHISQSSSWARKSMFTSEFSICRVFKQCHTVQYFCQGGINICVWKLWVRSISVDERMHFFSKECFNKSVASSFPGTTIHLWFWP